MLFVARARATLYYVDFLDENIANPTYQGSPENAHLGGPHWSGVVDTDANTLSIYQWSDLPGTVEYWWVPNLFNAPLVWPAIKVDPSNPQNPNGIGFDVTDAQFVPNAPGSTTGTFKIDSTFGFISPVPASQMSWLERAADGTLQPRTYNTGSAGYGEFYPGWGGVRKPGNVNDVFGFILDVSKDERYMPLLPTNSDSGQGSALVDFARVTASLLPISNSDGGPAAVPEVPASVFGLAAVAVSSAIGCVARRRRG